MKNTVTYILMVMTLIGFISCESWFDVNPKSDIKEEILFTSELGFVDVLAGVYALMTKDAMYGRELTFGTTDVLAKYYDNLQSTGHEYHYMNNNDYVNPSTRGKLASVWTLHYKAIVNLNLLLENIDDKLHVFETEEVYQIIKGEALALRAFLHFDALRMFGPTPAEAATLTALPYMREVSNVATPPSSMNDYYALLQADLTAAQSLLQECDPFGPAYEALQEADLDNYIYQSRNMRMNYLSATATLARIHLYFDQKELALTEVNRLIDPATLEPMGAVQLLEISDSRQKMMANEILFGLAKSNMEETISPYFGENALELGLNNSRQILAFSSYWLDRMYLGNSPQDDDVRKRFWFSDSDHPSKRILAKYQDETVMPLMRISELYYIAAEASADAVKGLDYLNYIRAYRGLSPIMDAGDLEAQIRKEYVKEFFGEGQAFYYFKRRNSDFIETVRFNFLSDKEAVYQVPLPDSELDYGNYN